MFRLLVLVGLAFGLALPATAQGRFAGPDRICGGIAGFQCRGGKWCDPMPGLCRGADISGSCVRASPVCTRQYQPVCGCDGKTYGNDCERQAARVAKNHDGECRGRRRPRPR